MTYTPQQVAERYQVGIHTVLLWIRSGELAAVNVSRRSGRRPQWRISQAALEAFEIARAAVPPASPPTKRRRKSADDDYVRFYS